MRLRFAPEKEFPIGAPSHIDTTLDLAVLDIDAPKEFQGHLSTLPWDRVGSLASLKRADRVYSLGNPLGKPWYIGLNPDQLSGKEAGRLYFESNSINTGHSGGALLDESLDIIGMIRSDQPPYGEAIGIEKIIERLRQWNYPADLGKLVDSMQFVSVSAGEEHACAITVGGLAYCWGEKGSGSLGYGASAPKGRVNRVVGSLRFKSLSTGRDHTCGVTTADTAYCWGSNTFGEFGDGKEGDESDVPVTVSGGLSFRSVSANLGMSCGVTTNGTAYCWGRLFSNRSDRTSNVPRALSGGMKFESLSAGSNTTCGMTTLGAYCLDSDAWGQLNVPVPAPGKQRFASVTTFGEYPPLTCGVTAAGAAYCWGHNDRGQLGNGAGGDRNTSANNSDIPVPVSGGIVFNSVSAGKDHACGVANNGAAYCWGSNEHGELGNGSLNDSNVPVAVSGGLKFKLVSSGYAFNCGITSGGIVYCWGDNSKGQLGNGSNTNAKTPLLLSVRP